MHIKTIQWNIGGGKSLHAGDDPTLLASYTDDGLDKIIDFIRVENPDIITLQETHAAAGTSQTETIAKRLGYKHWVNDEYADSHIEAGQRLGQGVISRFPIVDHSYELFLNPHFKATWEDGSIAESHDKGRTRCNIELGANQHMLVQTFHTLPFRRFKVAPTSDDAKKVLSDMASKLSTKQQGIIQADFNLEFDDLSQLFPELSACGFTEAKQPEPTTIRGHRYEHILALDLDVLSCKVSVDVPTDHFPLINRFKV